MGEMIYPKRLSGSVKKTFSVAVLTVLTGLLLSGCAVTPSPAPADVPASSSTAAPSSAPAPGATTTKPAVSTPKLDAAQEDSLLAELKKIDPALDSPRTVVRVKQSCRMILQNSPEDVQLSFAKRMFRDASMAPGSGSDEAAKKIIAVIKSNGFCKAGG